MPAGVLAALLAAGCGRVGFGPDAAGDVGRRPDGADAADAADADASDVSDGADGDAADGDAADCGICACPTTECVGGACALPPRPIRLAAGGNHSCAVREDGTLHCWGWNIDGQTGQPLADGEIAAGQVGPWADWLDVAPGFRTTCALRAGGIVYCFGSNGPGARGIGPAASGPDLVPVAGTFAAIAMINVTAFAVDGDGGLWGWGRNRSGELGLADLDDRSTPTRLAFDDVRELARGAHGQHMCLIRAAGTLWCWGANEQGQLGRGTRADVPEAPAQVGTDTDWVEVAVGGWHTCARKADGSAWCWGANDWGQLGAGSPTDAHAPQRVPGLPASVGVSVGRFQTCSVASGTGELHCWGANISGLLGLGDEVARAVPSEVPGAPWELVSTGQNHTVGVTRDGALWGWGWNRYRQATAAGRSDEEPCLGSDGGEACVRSPSLRCAE